MAPPAPAGPATIIYLRAVGGESASPATLAPKVGPLGMAPKKVGDDIQKATMDWKGLKITVKLTVVNRQATVMCELIPIMCRWKLFLVLLL
ncbi:60S ribosomal protein L12 [Blastocystis sp. subtype 4]|uniref:60S ribosomal protein L12 n=1 Tax=Blastocystis sp. subtype 4 TaxID=944170 RepID=UPI0007122270|nr:60S ribosomal protein L12 [Blastocystis sp. subtype 4]KNB44926.1 60S ribosomal protein L12 [Blastocystis sp. subtype 4]|eukprot:XP_014528369.1 60S ribosomal protein L12 [Blastocystis sp. subtype 4]